MNLLRLLLSICLACLALSRTVAQTVTVVATDSSLGETLAGAPANPAHIRFTRTGATTAPLTVWVRVTGTALQNIDYRFPSTIGSFVTIPAGSAALNVPVQVLDDWVIEPAETIRVELEDETNAGTPVPYAIGADDRVDLVVTDNENPLLPPRAIVSVVAIDAVGAETPPGTNPAVFRVSRTNNLTVPLDVSFVLGGTAVAGTDYTAPASTVSIPAGVAFADVTIAPIDDPLVEGNEIVTLTLQPHPSTADPAPPEAYVLGTPTAASVTIVSEDVPPPPTVTLTSPVNGESHTQPASQPHTIVVNFTASDVNGHIASYRVFDGPRLVTSQIVNYPTTPAPGTPFSGTATIPDAYGGVHPIRVQVTDNSGIVSTSAIANVTVTYIYPVMTVSALDTTAAEVAADQPPNPAVFSITVDAPMPVEQFVFYRLTSPGPGVDFVLPPGYSLTNWPIGIFTGPTDYGIAVFPAGSTRVDIVVTPVDDLHLEGDETLTLELSYPFVITEQTFEGIVQFTSGGFHVNPNAVPVRNFQYDLGTVRTATAVIQDNDTTPAPFSIVSLAVADSDAQETAPSEVANPGAFTVTRDGPTTQALTVRYAVTAPPRPTVITSQVASAVNGTDYALLSGTVTIPAGAVSASIVVAPIWDLLTEPNEIVQITLRPSAVAVPDPASYMLGATVTASFAIRDAALPAGTPTVRITAFDSQAFESTAPSRNAAFAVHRTGDTATPLTVAYSIAGSATNGVDYQLIPGTVTIPAGAASAQVVITPIDDLYEEEIEGVSLTLQPPPLDVEPPAYALGSTSAMQRTAGVTIRDYYVAPLNRFERARRLRFPGRYTVIQRPRDPLPAPPPALTISGWTVEASTDLTHWAPIGSVELTEDVDEFVDVEADAYDQRFYRFVPVYAPAAL